MEISKILTADFLDIIFDGRNKEYGAYELRKSYGHRLRVSITVMVSLVLLLVAGFIFGNNNQDMLVTRTIDIPDNTLAIVEPPKEEIIVPPPPAVKSPEVMERRNLEIVVVPDDKVRPEDEIPEVEELEDAKFTLVNKDGPKFDELSMPAEVAHTKGITELPVKRHNEDSIFLSVQIPSSYPGGDVQWARFLNKNLSRAYPQEAADQGIQGRVVIQFIVDREGNVSEVQAIAGPVELHNAAINVIKKSGKWIPAEQNGHKVKSRKSQPIIFSLGDE
jgi:protein TonB